MGGQGAYGSGRQKEYERHLTIGSREGENITPTTYHLVAVSHHVRQSFSSSHYTTTLVDPRKSNLMWSTMMKLYPKPKSWTTEHHLSFLPVRKGDDRSK